MATSIDLPQPKRVERRFLATLGLSLALHAAVLAWTRGPQHAPLTPAQVLTATLRMVVPAAMVEAPARRPEPVAAAPLPETGRPREMAVNRRTGTESRVAAPANAPQPLVESPALPAAPAALAVVAEPPAPPAKPVPSQASLLDAYGRQLAHLFSRQQEYPRLAAMRGWEGEVLVRLRVARKGNLLGVQVDRSSGFEVLDQHAVSMLEHIPGLPPLPEGVEGSEVQVVVPVSYKLKKAT